MDIPKHIAEKRDDFINQNFKVNSDGDIKKIRSGEFNGNGLLTSLSINDLEDAWDACYKEIKRWCPCGDVILEDTEKWPIPMCYECSVVIAKLVKETGL